MKLSEASLDLAGILLITVVTIEFGGLFLLRVVQGGVPTSDLQKSFFRAGHAHAGVLVLFSLVVQLYVDASDLSGAAEWIARSGVPIAALLIPGGFFFSVAGREAVKPNRLIWMIYAGAAVLAICVVVLGIGLLAT